MSIDVLSLRVKINLVRKSDLEKILIPTLSEDNTAFFPTVQEKGYLRIALSLEGSDSDFPLCLHARKIGHSPSNVKS